MSHDANYRPDRIQSKPERRTQGQSVVNHNQCCESQSRRTSGNVPSGDCSWLKFKTSAFYIRLKDSLKYLGVADGT